MWKCERKGMVYNEGKYKGEIKKMYTGKKLVNSQNFFGGNLMQLENWRLNAFLEDFGSQTYPNQKVISILQNNKRH